jgi:hypothetical protein
MHLQQECNIINSLAVTPAVHLCLLIINKEGEHGYS